MSKVAPEEKTGVQKILAAMPVPSKPSSWQMFITGGFLVLIGDHVGLWDIDGWFAGGQMTTPELIALITALGGVYTMFSKGRRAQ